VGTILQQAQTIEEKLTGYTEGTEVDFTCRQSLVRIDY